MSENVTLSESVRAFVGHNGSATHHVHSDMLNLWAARIEALEAENERLRSLFDTHVSEMGTGWSDSDLHAMQCLLDVLRAAALRAKIGGE